MGLVRDFSLLSKYIFFIIFGQAQLWQLNLKLWNRNEFKFNLENGFELNRARETTGPAHASEQAALTGGDQASATQQRLAETVRNSGRLD